ncbi:GMC family oxidoreductase N-terminal domain-containing protein [Cupriavidus sp. P-10]|nr:GMC family oxidoreductase N-terminal domain-containing protein [Cupriavidus sp. P-10]
MENIKTMDRITFDYVIVGAGAAGSILANRLSEDGKHSVCLLEAGGKDWHPFLHIPAGFIKVLFNPSYTWQFSSEPTDWTNGRRVPLPQGRTLGGSTSINGLVYNRGQRQDFEEWAASGNEGWSYAEVLPYFKRNERRLGAADPTFRSADGVVPVSDIAWKHPICEQFIAGAQGLGMPLNPDYNGETQAGVGYYQRTIRGRWRMSTARTYLAPARKRHNLSILTTARATKVLFDGKQAVGVRYVRGAGSGEQEVSARREVIICSGAINTPKLLQLSGVGPADFLRSMGVQVVHDLPGVGENLTDHYSVRLVASARNIVTMNELARAPRLWGQIANWLFDRPNILSLSPSLVHWFWSSRSGQSRPDLQGVFSPASYREGYVGMLDTFPGMTCGVWQHRPYSKGSVRIVSRNFRDLPHVQPNYLADERDRATLVGGMKIARRLLETPELSQYVNTETLPGKHVQRDDELLDFARRFGVSSYHVNGTAKMGLAGERLAVVDSELRVHGLRNLRIVDASVMPQMPSANTCAATMMIAEKASDMILGRAPLTPETKFIDMGLASGKPFLEVAPDAA